VVVEDRLLEALDEAIGEGVPGLGAGEADAELVAGEGKGSLGLAAAVGEHALDRPAGLAEGRGDVLAEEARGHRRARVEDPGEAVGGSGIASRDLPDLPDAFELSNVEAVEADEVSGLLGLDVALRRRGAGPLELAAGALGERAGVLGAVLFEKPQRSRRVPRPWRRRAR
jgi:hypothetical protein